MIRKMSKRKKIIVGAILALVVVGIVSSIAFGLNGKKSAIPVQFSELKKMDLTNSINISGTVKSAESENVYTTLSYQIKKVNVEVGDVVQAGDILAILNTDSLAKDIKAAEESNKISKLTTQLDLANKKRSYENTRSQVANGTSNELLAVTNALEQAKMDVANKQDSLDYNQLLFDDGEISAKELKTAEDSLKLAKSSLVKAQASYTNTKKQIALDLKRSQNDILIATANSNNKSQEITLEKQKSMLKDGKLVAPISGTVTMVNAIVGNVGGGVLFVVEKTDDLQITSAVKEVDVAKVMPNQNVNIKSDSTGDKVIKGVVLSIAPAAKKGPSGEVLTSGDATFETKVKVLDQDSGLRIGVSSRLSVILDEKKNIYAVPYEAVMENSAGKKSIFVIEKNGNSNIVKEISITTAMETDFYIEIAGAGLKDGMKVITNPTDYKVGAQVMVKN